MAIAQPAPRPDLVPFEHAKKLDDDAVVSQLMDLLGPKLATYIAGEHKTATLTEWSNGVIVPEPHVVQRLRTALAVATVIADHDDRHIARAWMQGKNPQLSDFSPARMLRDGDLEQVTPLILDAARAYLVGG